MIGSGEGAPVAIIIILIVRTFGVAVGPEVGAVLSSAMNETGKPVGSQSS
jgi:hypothetical protein